MLGIVILNYNNPKDTINCVDSIMRYTDPDTIKIVVVDNASRKEVVDELEQYFRQTFQAFNRINGTQTQTTTELPFITYLVLDVNIGYARGNNSGLELLYRDPTLSHVMILNNDILFTMDIVPTLIDAADQLPKAAIVSPLLFKKDGISIDYTCARRAHTKQDLFITYMLLFRNSFGIMDRIRRKINILQGPLPAETLEIEIELPSGSCMLARKELFRELGSFDPNTFLYMEENILYKKIEARRLKNYLILNVSCIHLGAATTSTVSNSVFVTRCGCESTNYYLRTYTDAGRVYLFFINIFYTLMLLKIKLKKYVAKN